MVIRNPEIEKESKHSNPRRFMTDMVAYIKRMCKKDSIACDIDLDHMCGVWERQNGRCALTGVLMTHTDKSLCGVRIDRINDKDGYIKGNVHLVCDGIKRMRKDMSVEEIKLFMQEIKNVIVIN